MTPQRHRRGVPKSDRRWTRDEGRGTRRKASLEGKEEYAILYCTLSSSFIRNPATYSVQYNYCEGRVEKEIRSTVSSLGLSGARQEMCHHHHQRQPPSSTKYISTSSNAHPHHPHPHPSTSRRWACAIASRVSSNDRILHVFVTKIVSRPFESRIIALSTSTSPMTYAF